MGVASVSACTSAGYYLLKEHALYVTEDGRVGVWYGPGAAALGFSGRVRPEELIAAFEGLGPDGHTRYVKLPEGDNVRKPAWDITFSVPKSISVFWSVCDEYDRERIERIVMEAARRAINYIDSAAMFTRRGKGGIRAEHAKGVYALFPHGTSRSLDPQLHLHCLAINMCLRKDGTTGAIRSKDIYLHKMAAGAIFRAELAYLIQNELGLPLNRDSWKFEVPAVPKSLCDEQSKRRQAIEELAKEKGWKSPRLLAELAVETRGPKEEASLEDCFENWQATAAKHNFTRETAEKLLASGERRVADRADQIPAHERNTRLKELLRQSIAALADRQSYFSERDVLQQVATDAQAVGFDASDIIAAVEQALSQFEYRVSIPGSDYRYYSTRENVATEKELLRRAEHGRFEEKHLVGEDALTKAKATVEERLSKKVGTPVTLTEDQDSCLAQILLEAGSIKLVQGYAGTGKTQLLEAAYLAWKAAGYQVLGTAIAGRAALGLQNTTGIESITVHGLLQTLRPNLTQTELAQLTNWQVDEASDNFRNEFSTDYWTRDESRQRLEVAQVLPDFWNVKQSRPSCQLTARSILVVDEAAMLPTKILLALMQECDKVGAKLVLVGDKLQLPPIEAGGPFASLANRLGCASLTMLVRQRKAWMRGAVTHLINNEPREALAVYAANDALRLEKHQRAAVERLLADYSRTEASDYSKSLALVSTKAEARVINEGVQTQRKASKQLGSTSIALPNGERVYKNDRILLTMNDYPLDVRNGLLGTVVEVQWTSGPLRRPVLRVQLDEHLGVTSAKGPTITLQTNEYPHVQLGYAATTHKVAGITVERTYVLLGESMLNKEMAFTQLTRASHHSVVYGAEAQSGDSLDFLAWQMSRPTAKDLANDYELVQQPVRHVRQGREWMQEAIATLASKELQAASPVSASLNGLHLSKTQREAAQLLINHYGKLVSHEIPHAIAVTSTDADALRINQGIQAKRKAKRELGVDSIHLPNGELVFKNDRVLLTVYDGLKDPVERMGSVTGFHHTLGRFEHVSVTIRLDAKANGRAASHSAQTVTVDARDFTDLQLGYAAPVEKTKNISVETSFVLLGEVPSKEVAYAQLACASRTATLYGIEAKYRESLSPLAQQLTKQTQDDFAHNYSIQQKERVSHELSQNL